MFYSFSSAQIFRQYCAVFLGLSFLCSTGAPAEKPTEVSISDYFDVRHFGAVGDGKTDDTEAFQRALDATEKDGGGVVCASRGSYFFAGRRCIYARVCHCRGIPQSCRHRHNST
jgi:hypothetical protein